MTGQPTGQKPHGIRDRTGISIVTITRDAVCCAMNQQNGFILANCLVDDKVKLPDANKTIGLLCNSKSDAVLTEIVWVWAHQDGGLR